jgi:hypothetical protein
MKTYKEIAQDKINSAKSVKCIFDIINSGDNDGIELMKMIVENSNDFTKDVAEKTIEAHMNVDTEVNDFGEVVEKWSGRAPSQKQIWCMAYQVWNNINVYKS